jgi:hypothetical protein
MFGLSTKEQLQRTTMKPMIVAAAAFWIGLSSTAFAQVTCAQTGPGPDPVDPTLAPMIITWVTKAENNFGLTAANWHGKPARAATPAEAAALELQALTANWAAAARPGTVEAIFRAAVGHGVNVQYETLMISADSAHAKTHQFWVDTEAARAAACLALIHLPSSPR